MSWRDTIVDEAEQSAEEQQEAAPKSSWRDTIVEETPEMAQSSAEDVIMQGGPSAMESAARGGAQGLLFGLPDELGGAIQSGMDFASGLVGESPSEVNARLAAEGVTGDVGPTTSSEMYTTARDENRAADTAAAEANPYSYRGSELFGSLLGGVGTGAASAGRLGITQGAKLLSKEGLKNAAKIGALGAAEGGLQAGGYSEAESLGDLASDVGQGAALGGTVGALAPGALGAATRGIQKAGGTALAGAGLGGVAGYAKTEDDAAPIERLKNTLAGAGAGALAGKSLGVMGKYAGLLTDTPVTVLDDMSAAFSGSRNTGEILGSTESIMGRQANLESKASSIADRIAKQADSANLKMKRAEADFVEQQQKVVNAVNQKELDAANKQLGKDGSSLVSTIEKAKNQFGEGVNESYKLLEKAGMKYDTTEVMNNALKNLEALKGPAGSSQEQSIQSMIDSIVESRAGFTGEIMDARKLRNTISGLIKGPADPNTKRVLSETYKAINNDIADKAASQGLESVAAGLKAANEGYHSAVLMDLTTGARFGKAELPGAREARATGLLESLAQKSAKKAGETSVLENALRKIAPDEADNLIQRAKAVAVAKSKIKGAAKQDLKLAYAEELEAAKNKVLSQTENAAMDLEKLTGEQIRLSDSTQASQGLLEKLEGEAAGEVTRLEPVTKKLNQLLPTDADKRLLTEAKQAAKDLDLSKRAANKGIRTVAANVAQQVLARIGGVGEAAALKASSVAGAITGDIEKLPGKLIRSKPSQTVINALEKATPDQVKNAAAVVAQTAPEASKKMLNLAATSDPVKRRAIMFMLGQDSQFRQAMDQDEEMNMEGTVVTPNEE